MWNANGLNLIGMCGFCVKDNVLCTLSSTVLKWLGILWNILFMWLLGGYQSVAQHLLSHGIFVAMLFISAPFSLKYVHTVGVNKKCPHFIRSTGAHSKKKHGMRADWMGVEQNRLFCFFPHSVLVVFLAWTHAQFYNTRWELKLA